MKPRLYILALMATVALLAPTPSFAVTCPQNPSPALCTPQTPTNANAPIKVSTNKQYLQYKGAILPLVGQSSSYLCHVEQPGTMPDGLVPNLDYCTWANYQTYLGSSPGCPGGTVFCPQKLNVIQLWIALNHSPGKARGRTEPYCYEHPFQWTGTKWDLFDPDSMQPSAYPWEQNFFNRLRCVVQDAWFSNVIVEVTLFDPWQGNDTTGPWHQEPSTGELSFADERCFASLDAKFNNVACSNYPDHQKLYRLQEELVKKVAATLCNYPNVYYEIANELDYGPPTAAETRTWYTRMANALIAGEQACARPDHIFGANYRDNATFEHVATTSAASILSGHYTQIDASMDSQHGAIELLRTHHKGSGTEIDRVYSFNETKIVNQSGAPTPPSSQTRDSARAEAWEFMLSEGGVYDQYVDRWQEAEAANAAGDLGRLLAFLSTLPLANMERTAESTAKLPVWVTSGMTGYNMNDAQGGKTFWGAMHRPSESYVLFIHHSSIGPSSGATFKRYEPVFSSYSHPALKIKPNETYAGGAHYLVEWFDTVTGNLKQAAEKRCNVGLGQEITLASPVYSYDVVLRVTRTTTCP